MKIMQQYNVKYQAHINTRRLEQNQKLPPVKDRALVPQHIRADQAPHLSPVGSLTNLLTDLSSTGFRRGSHVVESYRKDVNKEIPLIIATELAAKRQRQLSIPPVLL